MKSRLLLAFLLVLGVSLPLRAELPVPLLHYQGYLTDVEGTPLEGPWKVDFAFFTVAAGGTAIFTESRTVTPSVGVFSVVLGSEAGNPLNVAAFEGGDAWLELAVAPKEGGARVVLAPRQRVTSHPYALWTRSAYSCTEATNALSLGGVSPEAFVTAVSLPASLEALGLGAYGDEEVAAYLLANGYLPGGGDLLWENIAGKPEDLLTLAGAEDSGLFLLADGSVVATGNLDIGGNELLNFVVQNGASDEAPEAPAPGQLWYDSDADSLKVYGADGWIAMGSASALDCDGCVDPSDLNFNYAGAATKDGAATKALTLECVGCVTLGQLSPGILAASNVSFLDTVAAIGATTVQAALEKVAARLKTLETATAGLPAMALETAKIATIEETLANLDPGNRAVVLPFQNSWDLGAKKVARQLFHVFDAQRSPKVLLYLTGAGSSFNLRATEPLEAASSVSIPMQYSVFARLTATAEVGATEVSIGGASGFQAGDLVMLYQTVQASDAPAGSWEFNFVVAASGTALTLKNPLQHRFVHCGFDCGLAQVVRAQQFDNNLVVDSGGVLTPTSSLEGGFEHWGGILFVQARSITVKNGGKIHANQMGFTGGLAERGHSECDVVATTEGRAPNCSGGGYGFYHSWDGWDNTCKGYGYTFNSGGAGGGNKTAGTNGFTVGVCASYYGYIAQAGLTKGEASGSTLHFGGGGGAGGNTQAGSGGDGGGIIVLLAETVTVEGGGAIEARGGDGTNGTGNYNTGGGGGAGGTIAIFAKEYKNQGMVHASGGIGGNGWQSLDGGYGGDGWVIIDNDVDSLLAQVLPADEDGNLLPKDYPAGVQIWLDGKPVTAALGDPNLMGAPFWSATTNSWGDGLREWATGELDLTSVGNWTLGQHKLEFKETGGGIGELAMSLYVVYPETQSAPPDNDTCAGPVALDVMTSGSVTVSGTTEDTLGKIKALDDYAQASCGGSGGPEVVYKLELTDWRRLKIEVASAFEPRVYLRKGTCATGALMACGTRVTETPDLKAGTYYLFVDADGNQQKGNFNLTLTATPPTAATNDVCPNAKAITIDPTTLKGSVYGVTSFSADNYNGTCGLGAAGAGAPDLVYSFLVPAGTETVSVSVDTAADPAKPWNAVLFNALNACSASFGSCAPPGASLTLSYPNPGTYYIMVDGKTAADKGEFNLTVQMVAN